MHFAADENFDGRILNGLRARMPDLDQVRDQRIIQMQVVREAVPQHDSRLCAGILPRIQVMSITVQQGLDTLRMLISQMVADGKARGELQPYVNGDVVATLLISACEGALMMTKLYGDRVHLHRAMDHLRAYFETLRA